MGVPEGDLGFAGGVLGSVLCNLLWCLVCCGVCVYCWSLVFGFLLLGFTFVSGGLLSTEFLFYCGSGISLGLHWDFGVCFGFHFCLHVVTICV